MDQGSGRQPVPDLRRPSAGHARLPRGVRLAAAVPARRREGEEPVRLDRRPRRLVPGLDAPLPGSGRRRGRRSTCAGCCPSSRRRVCWRCAPRRTAPPGSTGCSPGHIEVRLLDDAIVNKAFVSCEDCGWQQVVAPERRTRWYGHPCPRYRCRGFLTPPQDGTALRPVSGSGGFGSRLERDYRGDYYRRLYLTGGTYRVVTAEHTGMLTRPNGSGWSARSGRAPTTPIPTCSPARRRWNWASTSVTCPPCCSARCRRDRRTTCSAPGAPDGRPATPWSWRSAAGGPATATTWTNRRR